MVAAAERFEAATAVLAGVLTGAAVGVVGSAFHRVGVGSFPWGILAAVTAVALGAVFVRALAGRGEYAAYALAVLASIAAAWFSGDRIVLGAVGAAWGIGAATVCLAGFALPERWFG